MKLCADLFLCANKPDAAIDLYVQSIEISRNIGDALWQATAMKFLYTALLIKELKNAKTLVLDNTN
jgi:hypothetical protein